MVSIKAVNIKVVIWNKRNETFYVNNSVRQADALSALFLNFILHSAIGKLNTERTLCTKDSLIGAYANNVIIMDRRESEKRKVFEELGRK